MRRIFNFFKIASLVIFLGLVGLLFVFILQGRSEYQKAWSNSNVSSVPSSPQFELVAKNAIDFKTTKNILIQLSVANLVKNGDVESRPSAVKQSQILLAPYIYLFADGEESYMRIFHYGYFGATNNIGDPLFGVESMSQQLWGIKPQALTVAQSALLVAMSWSPSYFNPYKHPDRVIEKRNKILQMLVEKDIITSEASQLARNEPLGLVKK
ncbi:MAG: transglycosylase domain-containing protein [Pseudobdellovibrionaceae bacterium]|nr:MAG: transglycosylase domain-containing protein [Pseudobdellovibrionaceae bacterium]